MIDLLFLQLQRKATITKHDPFKASKTEEQNNTRTANKETSIDESQWRNVNKWLICYIHKNVSELTSAIQIIHFMFSHVCICMQLLNVTKIPVSLLQHRYTSILQVKKFDRAASPKDFT